MSGVRHACCVALYFDPAGHPDDIAMATATVTELITDRVVDFVVAGGGERPEAFTTDVVRLARRYRATIHYVADPVPLVECRQCKSYLFRTIKSRGFAAMREAGLARRWRARLHARWRRFSRIQLATMSRKRSK